MNRRIRVLMLLPLLLSVAHPSRAAADGGIGPPATSVPTASCFLLFELGVGEIRRNPSEACRTRVSPASTFKVPHALAALDAGVVAGPGEIFAYDGTGQWPESSRRDHTLATAVRHSVVWVFQRVAERLGVARANGYLRKFSFGNMDASSGLTTFWLGGSLLVTPEEQESFWVTLYQNDLPVAARAMAQVKAMLVQPAGVVVNSLGEQPLNGPWPATTILSAKTGGATDRTGRGVRWLAGHVTRGDRAFVFVSCVIGARDLEANAAVDLAARSLREAHVL